MKKTNKQRDTGSYPMPAGGLITPNSNKMGAVDARGVYNEHLYEENGVQVLVLDHEREAEYKVGS